MSGRLTKFALNKEKVALFRLRAECGAVLKLDSGDMLVVADLTPLLRMEPGRDVWAVQALGQPTGNLNGGLMLFGRYWLHAATERALTDRAGMEAREQHLFNAFFHGSLKLLPKRYNSEHRMWDTAHATWLIGQNESLGAQAAPSIDEAAIIHFVGRDKPWMLRDTMSGKLLDPEVAACSRRATVKESAAAIKATCRTQQHLQALWWRAFGAGRTIVVGDSALKRGQGFVVEQFETVLRMHRKDAKLADVGRPFVGQRCADAAICRDLVRGELFTVGEERGLQGAGLQARTLLGMYRRKVGVFGGLV